MTGSFPGRLENAGSLKQQISAFLTQMRAA
jgi:hypothetical protein